MASLIATLCLLTWIGWALAFCPRVYCDLKIWVRLLIALGSLVLLVPWVSLLIVADVEDPALGHPLWWSRRIRRVLTALGLAAFALVGVVDADMGSIQSYRGVPLVAAALSLYGLGASTMFFDLWIVLNVRGGRSDP